MKLANEIKIFKLVDGSFTVGKVDRNEEFIEDVIDIAIRATETGGITASIMPCMFPFNNEMTGISMKFSRVMCWVDCPKDIENQYIQATTGIIPSQNLSGIVPTSNVP